MLLLILLFFYIICLVAMALRYVARNRTFHIWLIRNFMESSVSSNAAYADFDAGIGFSTVAVAAIFLVHICL